MKTKLFARFLLLLPVYCLFLLIELDFDHVDVYFSAGQRLHLFIGFVVLAITLYLGEKLLEYKKVVPMIGGPWGIVIPAYFVWILLFVLFAYQIVSSYSNYGVWSKGVSKMNSVLDRIEPDEISKTNSDIQASIAASKKLNRDEIIKFTQDREFKFKKVIECLNNQNLK